VIVVRLSGRSSPVPTVNGTEFTVTVPAVTCRREPSSQNRLNLAPVVIPWPFAIVRVPTVVLVRIVSWPVLAAATEGSLMRAPSVSRSTTTLNVWPNSVTVRVIRAADI